MALGYMSLSSTAEAVFTWLQDLVACAQIMSWLVICTTYLRFYYAMKKQGISRSRLPWAAPLQPYAAWMTLIALIIILLTGGYTTFIHGQYVPQCVLPGFRCSNFHTIAGLPKHLFLPTLTLQFSPVFTSGISCGSELRLCLWMSRPLLDSCRLRRTTLIHRRNPGPNGLNSIFCGLEGLKID